MSKQLIGHTKGPWTCSWDNRVHQGESQAARGKLVAICDVGSNTEAEHQEALANARCIAALPDLLEALQSIATSYPTTEEGAALVSIAADALKKLQEN